MPVNVFAEEDEISAYVRRNVGPPSQAPEISASQVSSESRASQAPPNSSHLSHPPPDEMNSSGSNRVYANEFEYDDHMDEDDPIDALSHKLRELYGLNDHHFKIAQEGSKCDAAQRHAYTMFGQAAILQKLSEQNRMKPEFNFNNTIKGFIASTARLTLLSPTVDAYSTTTDRHGRSLPTSLPLICRDEIEQKPVEWKLKHLAPGHLEDDAVALSQFNNLLSDQLKQHRGALRTYLLKNILQTKRITIKGPVPRLTDLIVDVFMNFLPKKDRLSLDVVKEKTNSNFRLRLRIALLRIVLALHILNENQLTTNWEQIDERLNFLRGQTLAFQQKHAEMLLQKDERLFSHNRYFKEISEKEEICLPKIADVHAALGTVPDPTEENPAGSN